MGSTWSFVASGAVFGLAAGLTPGPLLTLVITHALRHGARAGMKVAVAPLITDVPIVLVAVFVLTRLASSGRLLGGIALLGAGFLAYLAYDSLTCAPRGIADRRSAARSLEKGVLANVLNPHPYLFWIAIGAPTLLRARAVHLWAAVGFLVTLYGCLVGSKMLLAWAVGHGREVLDSRLYRWVVRALGIALGAFAALFLRDGLRSFGLV